MNWLSKAIRHVTCDVSGVASWWRLSQERAGVEVHDRGPDTHVCGQPRVELDVRLRADESGSTLLTRPQHGDVDAIDAVLRARSPERRPIGGDSQYAMG